MEDIYFRVEDEVIVSTQFDKIILQNNDADSDLGGTTTNNSPVPTVTPSRESSQQMKTKKKTKSKKKKKKKSGSLPVWKIYESPTENPFVSNINKISEALPEEGDEDKEIETSIVAMNNLRMALENEHKHKTKNEIYTVDKRAADIWKLNRHFNIARGAIPRGTYNPMSYRTPAQDTHATSCPELTRHLEILQRGNIGDVLQFTSDKYGHCDSFYLSTRQDDNTHHPKSSR